MKKLFPGLLASLLLAGLSHCGKETIGPITDIGVYINEIQSTGGDWLEIYNSTSASVSLSGFKVYDDPAAKFTIVSGSIPANGFFILTCDGLGVAGSATFKLTSLGETVYLEDNKGNVIDQVDFPALTTRSSYARFPDGGDVWEVTGDITKNATNGAGHAPIISLVSRTPLVPDLSEAVTVKATVTDVSGISSPLTLGRGFSRRSKGIFLASLPVDSSVRDSRSRDPCIWRVQRLSQCLSGFCRSSRADYRSTAIRRD